MQNSKGIRVNHRAFRIRFILLPVTLLGAALRTLVPGEMLMLKGHWLLLGFGALHILVHYLYAYRRSVLGRRFGFSMYLSHFAYLVFMLLQVEEVRGEAYPTLFWLLHMGGAINLPELNLEKMHPVINTYNLGLLGFLLFSYTWMFIEAMQKPKSWPQGQVSGLDGSESEPVAAGSDTDENRRAEAS